MEQDLEKNVLSVDGDNGQEVGSQETDIEKRKQNKCLTNCQKTSKGFWRVELSL